MISASDFEIHGLAQYVEGVKGSAMKFDRFSTCINGCRNYLKYFMKKGLLHRGGSSPGRTHQAIQGEKQGGGKQLKQLF